jgi:hypothetical protein
MSSISGRVVLILGNCLLGDLDLIMCRRLNSKSEKQFESAIMLWSEAHFWYT